MKVTYTPAGDAPQVFDFKPNLVRAAMAEMIETRADMKYAPWVDAVLQGSVKARRVLLWHLLSRVHGNVRIEDVDFAVGELVVERDLEEAKALRGEIASWTGKEEIRVQALAEIDAEIATLETEEGPKATSASDSESTPSPSPTTSI